MAGDGDYDVDVEDGRDFDTGWRWNGAVGAGIVEGGLKTLTKLQMRRRKSLYVFA